MTEEQLLEINAILLGLGIRFWIAGGWAIDALVGKQTREHQDVDIAFDTQDEKKVIHRFVNLGFQVTDDARPTRFVLKNSKLGLEIDMHPVAFGEDGVGRQWVPGGMPFVYPQDAFAEGMIDGQRVSCLSAKQLVKFHLGYPPLEKDRHNMRMLSKHLGINLPEIYQESR